MTQQVDVAASDETEPLNPRQMAFARYLGIAIAKGGTDRELVEAYKEAGYSGENYEHARGNARRLAADPRVKAIAEKACQDELEVIGLRIGYLQGKALEMLHASPTKIYRVIQLYEAAKRKHGVGEVIPEELAELEELLDKTTWPLNEFKIDKDGIISIKLPDKKGLIEMLAKQLGHGKDDSSVNIGLTLEQIIAQSMTAKEDAA